MEEETGWGLEACVWLSYALGSFEVGPGLCDDVEICGINLKLGECYDYYIPMFC